MVDVRKSPFLLSEEQAAWVESTRASLSIEEKAGQLFCIMGGDYAPGVVMQAVSELLQEDRDKNIEIVLVGHLEKLSYYIEKYGLKPSPRLEFVHAETVVEMADLSTASIRSKKNSSITVCAGLVAEGRAAGVVSAGHTGAAVASIR